MAIQYQNFNYNIKEFEISVILQIAKKLSSLQIITRYCHIESPYWHAFVSHYAGHGVKLIHACVQTEEEKEELLSLEFPKSIVVKVYLIPFEITPAEAITYFDIRCLSSDIKYTAMLDVDEFLSFLNPALEIDDICNQGFINVPWVMNPLSDISKDNSIGYWGHSYKPIVQTKIIDSVVSDHMFKFRFRYKLKSKFSNRSQLPHYYHSGIVLIHYWSRGINDVILKTFFSRFNSFKQKDQNIVIEKIIKGDLPNRLKIHAYLSTQNRYIKLPLKYKYELINLKKEEKLMNEYISKEHYDKLLAIYNSYENYLKQLNDKNGMYPSALIPDIQSLEKILPSVDI